MTVNIQDAAGNIIAGGEQSDGDLVLTDQNGKGVIHLDATHSNPFPFSSGDDVNIFVDGKKANVRVGRANEKGGRVTVHSSADKSSIVTGSSVYTSMISSRFGWFVGDDDSYTSIQMYQPTIPGTGTSLGSNGYTVKLSSSGNLKLGDGQIDGDIQLQDQNDTVRVALSGGRNGFSHQRQRDRLRANLDGENAEFQLGGGDSGNGERSKDVGKDGKVVLKDKGGDETVELDAGSSSLVLQSPSGNKFRVTVDDNGDLTTTPA
jgi:hypothetical protein